MPDKPKLMYIAKIGRRYGGPEMSSFLGVERPATWKVVEKKADFVGWSGVYLGKYVRKEKRGQIITSDPVEAIDFLVEVSRERVEDARAWVDKVGKQLDEMIKLRKEMGGDGNPEVGQAGSSDAGGGLA